MATRPSAARIGTHYRAITLRRPYVRDERNRQKGFRVLHGIVVLTESAVVGAGPGEAASARSTAVRWRIALVAMSLLVMAAWLLQHPYAGINHDSTLYTLFALAKLHPHTLDNDIFLRFGSQDRYTLFTPLYAAAINLLGLEHAAALLTLVSQMALAFCAWLLARCFMPPLAATLGVALMVVVPGEYGAGDTFHYLEPFLTPRLPTEVLVLAALVAALTRRYWTAAVCIMAAMLLHPIMAAAGAAMLILTFVAPLRPKFTLVAAVVMFVGSLAIVVAIAPIGRLDNEWLLIVLNSSHYLFISTWTVADWSRVAVPLGILATGWLTATAPLLRRLCGGILITVACGLVITIGFCDMLHVSIFIDLQSWRWLWLANVLAFILTPAIGPDCWRHGASSRIAVILLASAWSFRGTAPPLYIVPAALACAAVPKSWSNHMYWRPVSFGAWALLALVVGNDLIDRLSYLPAGDLAAAAFPQKVRAICANGVIPGALMIGALLLLRRSASTAWNVLIAVLAALACGALVPLGWESWTGTHYTPALVDKFSQWRAEIPAHAEVIWPDTPIGAWYLLQRPSYWSAQQVAGDIFSRDKAAAMRRRTISVNTALRISHVTDPPKPGENASIVKLAYSASRLTRAGMVAACTDRDLRYIVSWMPLAPTPFAPITIDPTKPNGKVYLYRCADLRI